jgi:hypothetical protein
MLPTAIAHYFAFLSSPGDASVYHKYESRTTDLKDLLYSLHVGEISSAGGYPAVGGAEIGQLIDFGENSDFEENGLARTYRQLSTIFAEGYEWDNGKTNRVSRAVTLRAMLVASSLDMAFGAYDKCAFIDHEARQLVRQAYGLRTDLGFSIFSFYLTAGAEPGIDAKNRTYRQFAVGAGVSATINGRRLWNELSASIACRVLVLSRIIKLSLRVIGSRRTWKPYDCCLFSVCCCLRKTENRSMMTGLRKLF